MVVNLPSKQRPLKKQTAMFISGKVDFNPELSGREKSHFLLLKGAICGGDIMILSVYAQEVSAYIIFKRPNGHKGADGTTYINKGDISTLISLIDAVQRKKSTKKLQSSSLLWTKLI